MLRVAGLEAAYGSSQVLFGIDFEVNAGEVNGEGKGTAPTTTAWVLGWSQDFHMEDQLFKARLEWVQVDPHWGNQDLPLLKISQRINWRSNYRIRGEAEYADTYLIDLPLGYYRGPDVSDFWFNLEHAWNSLTSGIVLGFLNKGPYELNSPYEEGLYTIENAQQQQSIYLSWFSKYHWNHLEFGLGWRHIQKEKSSQSTPRFQIGYILSF